MLLTRFLLLFNLAVSTYSFGSLPIGKIPPEIKLENETGGRTNGQPWSSSELKGKVHLVVYAAPSAKDLNNEASEALKKEEFPRDRFSSVAIVNMKSSWLPNFLIEKAIKSKQKDYPHTTYVKDKTKKLVKEWNLQDDSSDFVLFGLNGEVLYSRDGKLSGDDIKKLIAIIKEQIPKVKVPESK